MGIISCLYLPFYRASVSALRSGTLGVHAVSMLLKSSFFTRHAIRLLLAFTGNAVIPKQGLSLLRGSRRHGKLFLGIYIKALVELGTGSSKLGNISAAVSGSVVDEEARISRREQQPPVMFLQAGVSRRILQSLGVPASDEVPIKLVFGLTAAAYVVLLFLLVSFSSLFLPAVTALAILVAILFVVKNVVSIFYGTHPETTLGNAEQTGPRIFPTAAKMVKQHWK